MTDAQFGSRELFPDLQFRSYLNHASVSPPSRPVQQAVADWMCTSARLGLAAFPLALEQRERLRGKLAAVVGCAPADLALTSSTTDGLVQLACSIPFAAGDRILGFQGEFPANTTPWIQAAAATGARFELLPQPGVDDDGVLTALERGLREGARLVAVSAVQFSTGRVMPLREIVDLAHRAGAEVCVDAIQALGAMPFDAAALDVDYLAGGAHKWLMGLEGTGFVYIAPGRLQSLQPRTAGWLSHVDPVDFLVDGPGKLRYDKPIREQADYLEGHTMNTLGSVALEASLDRILALGIDAIHDHICRFNDALEVGLVDRGFTRLRSAGPRSGTLALRPPPGRSATGVVASLSDNGVSASAPDGVIRFSPQWPNHPDEVPFVLDAIG